MSLLAKAMSNAPSAWVSLDLPVEGADRRVEILAVARAEVVERPEDTRVELRDEVQDLGFDVVHVEPVRELGPVVLHGSLLEFREGPLDLLAVVGLVLVPVDPDAVAFDMDRIPHRCEGV